MKTLTITRKRSKLSAEQRRRALAHIKRCDDLFDGNGTPSSHESAYHFMRVLALELLDELS